jgi:molecular chaperone GrpE
MSDDAPQDKLRNSPSDTDPGSEGAGGPGQSPEASDETAEAREARLREEAAENWSKYLRAVAELDNLRKRAARDVENARRYGAERLAHAILPVRDSIEAALAALHGAETVDLESIVAGEQATLRLLDHALETSGVAEIDPHGEPFDPARHEAMSMLESPHVEPHSVLEVVQKGYSLHDRILRPARVIVAKEPESRE